MSGFKRRARRVVYENPWLRFEAHDIIHPNGRAGEHGLVVTPRACAIVVLDGAEVILTRQERFGARASVLEVVKGGAHGDETPLAAAQREVREEIGIVAQRWHELGITYEIPSILAEAVHVFLARDVRLVGSAWEDVETIESVRLPFAEALERARDGRLADAVSTVALVRCAHALSTGSA